MLFDFIKKRAQEGVEQTQNLVIAASEGRLDQALKETSEYVKERYVILLDRIQKQQGEPIMNNMTVFTTVGALFSARYLNR